ncbi:MAG: hypothetical protein ABIE84_06715 [bacterium]
MKLNYLEGISSVFVTGLGQIIKGETKKGLLLLLSFYFVLPALVYLSLWLLNSWFLIIFAAVVISAIIIWSYSVWEAFKKS